MSAILPGWQELSASERDAAYDNRAAVAEAAALQARRLARSARFRAAHPNHLDVAYGSFPSNRIDLFPAGKDAPWLVFIHGGYWLRNAGADFASMAEGPRAHGWSVAIPSYTLAPEARVSSIMAEVGTALDWLAEYRGCGAGRIVVAGWSAGATMAVLHANHPSVGRVVAISGLYDLAPLADTSMNQQLRLDADEIERLSPLRQPTPAKPITLVVGGRELPALRLSSDAMAAQLGGDVHVVPEADHFSILEQFWDTESSLCRLAVGATA